MMNEEVDVVPVKSTSVMRRLVVVVGVLLLVFLLGFVPMWLKARAATGSLAEAERQLTLAKRQDQLSSAVIDAGRGDYEPARRAASEFFISLRAGMDGKGGTALTLTQREGLQALFAGRDEVITLLARGDPASADRLSDLHVSYRKAMHD